MDVDAEDELEWWRIRSIELLTPDRSCRVALSFKTGDCNGTKEMWSVLDNNVHLSGGFSAMIVNKVDIQMKFKIDRTKPQNKYLKGTVTFSINWKDNCNLNTVEETHIRARRILKKSKIDYDFVKKTT